MREEWKKYLLNKVELRNMQTPQKKKAKNTKVLGTPKGFGILDGIAPVTPAQNAEASSMCKQEHDALLAAASEIRNLGKKDNSTVDSLEPQAGNREPAKGKGFKRNTRSSATIQLSKSRKCRRRKASVKDESQLSGSDNEGKTCEINSVVEGGYSEGSNHKVANAPQLTDSKPLPPVHFYALESDQPILDILKPSAIIVYHPSVTFVREIEVYKAENPSKKLKVYFLFYEDSTEVQKFEANIQRENSAFESLIRQKSSMMIPVDQV